MRKVLLFFLLFVVGWQMEAFAQEKKMTKAEREAEWRAERMKKKAAEVELEHTRDSIAFLQAVEALRSGSWALEASNISLSNGVTRFVTENTNFVSVNNGIGTVQTAFDNSNVYSPNGLGGITLQGYVSGERMSQDAGGNIYYSYTLQGNNVSAVVYVTLAANSNHASARVDPNFSGNYIIMNGFVYSYNNSGVFVGTTSYY